MLREEQELHSNYSSTETQKNEISNNTQAFKTEPESKTQPKQ